MKRITKRFAVVILCTCFTLSAQCQYYFYNEDYYDTPLTWETGFSLGGMNCLTDLGGKKGTARKFVRDINWSTTRPCGSLFIGGNYKDLIGGRLELTFGQVKASDDILKNDHSGMNGRYLRNLNFRSDIKELSFSLELFPMAIFERYNADVHLINPYILIGGAYFGFSPQTFYNNSWINVSDLHTEGQGFTQYPDRKMYKLTQWNMPFTLGFKYEFSPLLNFHFEVTYRKLWTDYLDDVSKNYIDPAFFWQYFPASKAALAATLADRRLTNDPRVTKAAGDIRGNEKNDDTYFSGSIKIAFVLGREKR